MLELHGIHKDEVGDLIDEFTDYWDWFNLRLIQPTLIMNVVSDRWFVKVDTEVYGIFKESELSDLLFYIINIKNQLSRIRSGINGEQICY